MSIFHPYQNIVICGASGSGKTTLLKKLVNEANDIFMPPPSLILFIYKAYDPDFDALKGQHDKIMFLPDLPNVKELDQVLKNQAHTLLILDDVSDMSSNPFYCDLLMFKAHHQRITPVISCQYLFNKGKFTQALATNMHGLILMPGPRDQSTVLNVGKQLGEYSVLKNIYRDVCHQGTFRYLLINCHPAVPREMRYLTNILNSDEGPLTIYLPKT